MNFIIKGSDYLAAHKGFKLEGRDADLERLTAVLLRDKSSSVILVGPGGVGCTALCMGLQASKNAPDAPFDVVSKRLFWLETDALFSSGTSEQIAENFQRIIDILNRTPESILVIEDARDFIEAARANGCGNFINSLNNAVRHDKTQVIWEARDDDLDVVFRAHSDMRERYTLLDLAEPTRDALRRIVGTCSAELSAHHGIRITDEAIDTAIELTTKYRTRDMGLSRAQPERTMTLLDRALATYRLQAHKQHPDMAALYERLGDAANSPEGKEQIAALQADFDAQQVEVKRLYKNQRDGEAAILALEEEVDATRARERERQEGGADERHEEPASAGRIRSLTAFVGKGGFESAAVQELRNKIASFQKVVDENHARFKSITDGINSKLAVGHREVIEQFSLISGISVSTLTQDERKKLRNLEANLTTFVFGQDDACRRLANAIKIAKVGRKTEGEPVASFLFMGPSGVGKTELAKVLTQLLLDDAAALTRFDMSEYMEKHAVAKLIGAPPGYEGFEAGGILTNLMRKNPKRVLLFDEIEKAHPDVFNLFLQILSDSRLTDNVGRVVSFDDAIIIMTTNIGQAFLLDPNLSDAEAEDAGRIELEKTYRPEFLNRFAGRENIVCFKRLKIESLVRIVRREIAKIGVKYDQSGLVLEMPLDAVSSFCTTTYDPALGARGPTGYIKANLEPVLANLVLEQPDFKGTVVMDYSPEARGFNATLVPTPESPCEEHRSAA